MKKRFKRMLTSLAVSVGLMTAMASTAGAILPVYNDYVYDQVKNKYLVVEKVGDTTASMSIGAGYQFNANVSNKLYGTSSAVVQQSYGFAQSYKNMWLISNSHVYRNDGKAGIWDAVGPYYTYKYSDETVLRINGTFKKGSSVTSLDWDYLTAIDYEISETYGTATKSGVDIPMADSLKLVGEIFDLTVTPIDNAAPNFEKLTMSSFNEIRLHYDENLRAASGNTDLGAYTLKISYANEAGTGTAPSLDYICTGISDNQLIYSPVNAADIPAPGRYQITGITGASSGGNNYDFEVWGTTELHEKVSTFQTFALQQVVLTTIPGMPGISDLAGNAVTIPSSLNLKNENIIIDTKAPSIEKVYLTGSDITKASEVKKNEDGTWPPDSDFSALYTGIGDQIYFNIQFDEVLDSSSSGGSITLNVQQNGKNVTVGNPSFKTTTNAMGETATIVTYGPFTLAEGMTMEAGAEGSPIAIKSLNGTFRDSAWNTMSDAELPVCAQGIRIDAEKPAVTIALSSWLDENGKATLTPTLKVDMSDTQSGIIGRKGKLGISINAPQPLYYKMAITDTPETPDSSAYTYSGVLKGNQVSAMNDIDLYSGTRYIHLDFSGNAKVDIYSLSAAYSLSDWAGNAASGTVTAAEYLVDTTAPVVTAPTISVNYTTEGAELSAAWSTMERNYDRGVYTYYMWSETKPDYNAAGWNVLGPNSSAETAEWALPEAYKIGKDVDASCTLWVYAKDAYDNRSTILSASKHIVTTTASSTFVLKNDPVDHLSTHEVLVTPDKSREDATAYTRVRITFGEGYVHNTATEAYKGYLNSDRVFFVTMNSNGGTQDVMQLIEINPLVVSGIVTDNVLSEAASVNLGILLDYWYGEVKMEFESAYYDLALTVQDNGKDIRTGILEDSEAEYRSSYSGIEGSISFIHVSDAKSLWNTTISDMKDNSGEEISFTDNKAVIDRTLEGISFTVNLETLFKDADNGVNVPDIDRQLDPSASSVVIRNTDDPAKVMAAMPLFSVQQTFTIPAGEYETGLYEIVITAAHTSGLAETTEYSNRFIVDNEVPVDTAGIFEYYITPGTALSSGVASGIVLDDNGMPYLEADNGYTPLTELYDNRSLYKIEKTLTESLESLTLSLAGQQETVRTSTYSNETSGLYNFGFTVQYTEPEDKYVDNTLIGEVSGINIWNPAVQSEEDAQVFNAKDKDGVWTWAYDSDSANAHYTWATNVASPNKTDGAYDMTGGLKLKDGENTICYQVVMENGNTSPVYELKIYVTSSTPSAGLDLKVAPAMLDVAAAGAPINIAEADASLVNVFSGSDIDSYFWLDNYGYTIVENYDTYTEGTNAEGSPTVINTPESVTSFEYSRYDVLRALQNGYYKDSGLPSTWGYAIYRNDNKYYNSYGEVDIASVNAALRDTTYDYLLTPAEADTVIRLDNDKNYGTRSTVGAVSVKGTGNTATGAFLIIDESGASVLVFPQINNEKNSYYLTGVKYNMAEEASKFLPDLTVNAYSTYVNYRGVEIEAEITKAVYTDEWGNEIIGVDPEKSYIVYTDADGNEVQRDTFADSANTSFGTDGVRVKRNSDIPGRANITAFYYHPITDDENKVGTDVAPFSVRLEIYDINTGSYLVSQTVTISQLEYRSCEPKSVSESIDADALVPSRDYIVTWQSGITLNDDGYISFNRYIDDILKAGTYTYNVADAWGNSYDVDITFDSTMPDIELSNTEATSQPITAKITVPSDYSGDHLSISWQNGTTECVLNTDISSTDVVYSPSSLSVSFDNLTAESLPIELTMTIYEPERIRIFKASNSQFCVDVNNVSGAIPEPQWSIEVSDEQIWVEDDEDTEYGGHYEYVTSYNGGDVTVYLEDSTGLWELTDSITGARPEYTFKWNDENLTLTEDGYAQYTFTGLRTNEELTDENGDIYYPSVADYTVTCPVILREYVAPEVEDLYPGLTEEEKPVAVIADDLRTPSVQVIPYAVRSGINQTLSLYFRAEDTTAMTDSNGVQVELNPNLTEYSGYTAYDDSMAMASAVGWASKFRFQIEVQDISRTKIVLKNGLYSDADVTYADAASDVISGVSLSGAILDVSAPAKFTVFVVDEKNNCTAFSMDISQISEAPIPSYTKEMMGSEVNVTFIAPTGGSDIRITMVDGVSVAEQTASFTASENKTYAAAYSYSYNGTTITGTMNITINDIDTTVFALSGMNWSANYSRTSTNQDVYAYLTFTKDVAEVKSSVNDMVTVLITGNYVTVRFTENTEASTMYFYAADRTMVSVDLPAVANIDRDAPVVTVGELSLSDDGKSVTFTMTTNETVSFREGGSVGTVFDRTVKKNDTFKYMFTDLAGNTTVHSVKVDSIVDTPLEMLYSLNADGSAAVDSPTDLGENIKVGDIFYVKVNRDAVIHFNAETVEADAGTWTQLTVGANSGGVIIAKDVYGNSTTGIFEKISFPDITPPTIDLKKYTVHVSIVNFDSEALKASLTDNAMIADDRESGVYLKLEYVDPAQAGSSIVTYVAYDAANNEAVIEGLLKAYDGTAPSITLDGVFVERDSICINEKDAELKLAVDLQGEPCEVSYKVGIKTAAQLKIGATALELDENGEVVLPFAGQNGYYTVCINTQNRDTYRFIVYIK